MWEPEALKGRELTASRGGEGAGKFQRGDVISVFDSHGKSCALGRCAYASDEIDRIKGLHTDQIEEKLGYLYADEMIHHDDLVLLQGRGGEHESGA